MNFIKQSVTLNIYAKKKFRFIIFAKIHFLHWNRPISNKYLFFFTILLHFCSILSLFWRENKFITLKKSHNFPCGKLWDLYLFYRFSYESRGKTTLFNHNFSSCTIAHLHNVQAMLWSAKLCSINRITSYFNCFFIVYSCNTIWNSLCC